MAFLALDVGNTRLKWALYDEPRVGARGIGVERRTPGPHDGIDISDATLPALDLQRGDAGQWYCRACVAPSWSPKNRGAK